MYETKAERREGENWYTAVILKFGLEQSSTVCGVPQSCVWYSRALVLVQLRWYASPQEQVKRPVLIGKPFLQWVERPCKFPRISPRVVRSLADCTWFTPW